MKKTRRITSKNPIVNEIVSFRKMDEAKIAKINHNKKGYAAGWLSDSRGTTSKFNKQRIKKGNGW